MPFLLSTTINIIAAVTIITIKESTKALVSSSLGDPLPKRDKRVTLNPLRHIEIIGLILLLATGLGWGKPVETSALYYKNRKRDTLLTNIAPFIILLVIGFASYYVLHRFNLNELTFMFLQQFGIISVRLAFFNLIPIPPLDGAKILYVFLKPNQVVNILSKEKMMLIILVLIIFILPNNPISRLINQLTLNFLSLTILMP